ncbi:MAG TPA: pyridoxal-phosphate dependent enzyme [Anaerolineaceae bacterium]|jgi:cysteine synthase|nr:pyridoxal-phosphate dependent enzyme [Anaerolineaceae bacterium]HNW14675.1 pyridoxal-phosphate dependent enzyme [Anaerolineaceae bacterium]HOE01973.1 pyridoxal-phosphate dependent enzyme [Anaerolineaceae bacterium]
MAKIDLQVFEERRQRAIERCRKQNILFPTFAQMKNPDLIPQKIKEELSSIGLWDIHPRNLFRITWKNEPLEKGGGYGGANYLELPTELTGVKARIIALVGKWFPTGAHKVGAAYGCLVPRLVTGQFDPTLQKAVWPSTGNYCRGGAYDSALMACQSIAILPEGMSRERFEWLNRVAGEVIATPGTESNVKEIFDKCWELRRSGEDLMIFNQFDEFGNYLWHYEVTGHAMEEVLKKEMRPGDRYRGVALTTGSAGTIASGDYLKQLFPESKIIASEALQCPTLLENGFGAHRIEGIGDKHVPWIHNIKNTDLVVAIDDNAVMEIMRVFNEPEGQKYLSSLGLAEALVSKLHLLGFSGIANLLSAIKFAKYYELGEEDIVLTVLTDSMELYESRVVEIQKEKGELTQLQAAAAFSRYLLGERTDNLIELSYQDRRRVHNLKYYTWVEQQGKTYEEILDQWYDPTYWTDVQGQAEEIDELIIDFNQRTGLL